MVGIIIGASIFVQPSEVSARVPSITGVLGVWFAAGALTLIGALVCAELASTFQRSGGVYVYLSEAFGPWLGFLWGWAMFWSMHSGIVAVIAVVFARYTGFLIPMSDAASKVVAIAAIVAFSGINYIGVQRGSRLQIAFTVTKIAGVVLIVLFGFVLGGRVPAHFAGSLAPRAITAADFFTALAAGLFAFGGWHMVTYSAEETVNPRTTIPRALVLGVLIVTASYVAMNAVYLYVLPLDQVAASPHVAADTGRNRRRARGGTGDLRPCHVFHCGSARRRRPHRPPCLPRHGAGWTALPLGRRDPPDIPHSASGDRPAGRLVLGPRGHRDIPRVVHAGGLYGMDLFSG